MAALASDWLKHFRLHLCSLVRLWWNLTGNKNIQSLLQVIFSGPTRKQRRMPLIYLHWFDVSSAASRNVMIFDSKQVLFRADVLTKVENGHLITYRARNYNCQRNHISPHFTMKVFSILKQNLIISLNFWSCGWKNIYIGIHWLKQYWNSVTIE